MVPRAFLDPLPAGRIEISGAQASYLLRVRRLGGGDEVEIFDGKGRTMPAVIRVPPGVAKKRQLFVIEPAGEATMHPRPSPLIHLAAAAPKGPRLDWLIEKIQELGAASFRPLESERSVRAPKSASENERLHAKLVEAARQSRRNFLTEIGDTTSLGEIFVEGRRCAINLILDRSGEPLSKIAAHTKKPDNVLLVVGPEGGFSAIEISEALAAGFVAVSLGEGYLRVETAAIAALSAVRVLFP